MQLAKKRKLPPVFTFYAPIFWCEPPRIFMYTSGSHLEDQWFIYLYAAFDSVMFHFTLIAIS